MTLIARVHKTREGSLHLRVGQSQFSDAAKGRLQRVGSPARWIMTTWEWDYPLTPAAVVALDAAARDLKEPVEWRDELKAYAERYVAMAASEHAVRLAIERVIREKIPLDAYITNNINMNLRDPAPPLYHQSVSYHWMLRTSGLYLAWDPGTGKSRAGVDAIGGFYRMGQIRPMEVKYGADGRPYLEGGALVVCPKTMLFTWAEELKHWQNATPLIVAGSSTKKLRLSNTPAHVHIVNYQGLSYVQHNTYDAVIFDEAHWLANHTTRTTIALGLAQRSRKKLALSGTPVSNNLESLFYQFLILDGGRTLGSSKKAYLERFFNSVTGAGGFSKHEPKPEAATAIAQAIAECTYVVRKSEVLDLPEKTHTAQYLEMTPEQARYYQQLKNDAVTFIQDASVTIEQAAARMAKLLQCCQGFVLADDGAGGRHFTDAKTEALVELLTTTYANRKVVVWAQHPYEIERFSRLMADRQIPHFRLDGTITSQKIRDAQVSQWSTDPAVRVFVRQLSMSEGVTLTAHECAVPCYDCIYLGLNYRFVDWKQSQDRIHRIGQRWPCSYTYLLTKDGIDRRVYLKVLEKDQVSSLVSDTSKDYYLSLLKD